MEGEQDMQEINLGAEQELQTGRNRVEEVVGTLATLRNEGESLAELAHDARNMVTALGLYCDLLEEPGVLATQFTHYADELRLVAAASRRLVEKLVSLDVRGTGSRGTAVRRAAGARQQETALVTGLEAARFQALPFNTAPDTLAGEDIPGRTGAAPSGAATTTGPVLRGSTGIASAGRWDLMPPELISNLAQELLNSRNLLSALAGLPIALTVDVEGGALPVRLNSEDLTRVLVNLVKNAAEAMPGGGTIRLGLRKRTEGVEGDAAGAAERGTEVGTGIGAKPSPGCPVLCLTVEDNGPGIPRQALERIFEAGFTTRATGIAPGTGPGTAAGTLSAGGWPSAHRGLGLSISRSIVEAAGGRIYATNREGPGTEGSGARFEIVLPVLCH
jgi:signal transduction histidine kinase